MPTLPIAPPPADSAACCGPDCCNDAPAHPSNSMAVHASSDLTATVREKYGAAAQRVLDGVASGGCCGPVNACCGGAAFDGTVDPITAGLYVLGETDELPEAAVLASLGCGNPTALAELREGELVLDLGLGRRHRRAALGAARRAHGQGVRPRHDRRDAGSRATQRARGRGRRTSSSCAGDIEEIPLPSNSVDVIISNCVINLVGRQGAGDRARRSACSSRAAGSPCRMWSCAGRCRPMCKRSMELWVGCVAGALQDAEFTALLREAGFESPTVEMTRTV